MLTAIIFVNTAAVAQISHGAIFKHVHNTYGFEIIDFFFMRNVSLFLVSLIVTYFMKIDIFDLPQDKTRLEWFKWILLRSVCGHLNFCLFNTSFLFAPVALIFIVFQTNPFFASIFGYFVNGESVSNFEIGGMVLCFGGICLLGLSSMNEEVTD